MDWMHWIANHLAYFGIIEGSPFEIHCPHCPLELRRPFNGTWELQAPSAASAVHIHEDI